MCEHDNTVEDLQTGTVICTDCAYLIDTPVFAMAPVTEKNEKEEPCYDALTLVFADLCFNTHLSPIYALDMALLFKTVIEEKQITYLQKSTLIALCFSEVLKRENVPRTLKEISGVTGESLKSLGALMKEVFPNSPQVRPHQIVSRFCGKLDIHRRHAIKIEHELETLVQVNSVSPDTLAAAAIADYVKSNALGVKLTEIADVCGVTQVSIRRQLKRLEQQK